MEAVMKRRQAILAGLAPYLREEQTVQALQIFDSSYAEGSSFNLQSYLDRLYAQLDPGCARRDLHRALVQSVFLANSDAAATSGLEEDDAAAANAVFTQLLGGFLQRIAAHDARAELAVRTYLIEKLSALGVAASTQRALQEWLQHYRATVAAPLPRETMRQLLNLAYVLVCEYLGPVSADRLLAEAVRACETHPAARQVAPRSLL